ncbi:calcineurin b-like protein [Balamuthia mandrillaris]
MGNKHAACNKVGRVHLNPLQNSQHVTRFNRVELKALKDVFEEVAPAGEEEGGGEGKLDREKFRLVLKKLQELGMADVSATLVPDRLFAIFDINHDGAIDKNEFLKGIALLTKGTPEEKLDLTFQAYCNPNAHHHKAVPLPSKHVKELLDHRKAFISRADMFQVFKAAYLGALDVAAATHPELEREELENERRCAAASIRELVDEAFLLLDTDGNGRIDYEEFKEWASQQPTITAAISDCYGGEVEETYPLVLSLSEEHLALQEEEQDKAKQDDDDAKEQQRENEERKNKHNEDALMEENKKEKSDKKVVSADTIDEKNQADETKKKKKKKKRQTDGNKEHRLPSSDLQQRRLKLKAKKAQSQPSIEKRRHSKASIGDEDDRIV